MASKLGERKFLLIGVGIIVVIFVVLILFGKSTPQSNKPSVTGSTPAPASVVDKVTGVSTSTFDKVGTGTADALPKSISAPALSQGGKPEVFYDGAEYCPYCATERWAVVASLARFGTFKNLGETHSSSSDVYPNTQSLSFYGSTYSSPYLTFVSLEQYTNIPNSLGYTTLQNPTSAEQALINKYDAAPYLSSSQAQSIPFIDFAGKYLSAGATYSPQVLQNKSASQIAASLDNPSNSIAQGVDGAANLFTATVCKLTNNKPATACDSTIQKMESGF